MKEKMNSQTSINSTMSNTPIKVFKYRWVILLVYGVISVINFMQLMQFTIISNIMQKFYNVESYLVDMTGLIFFISFILLFYPTSFLIEKYNLKFTVITATVLTLAGNLLKLLSPHQDRFWLILIAQFLISIGQVYLCNIPSKLATTWFGSEEVSTACAIAVVWMQLGSALGCVQSPFIVNSDDNDKVQSQLFDMFLYQAIATACALALVLSFFRSKPSLPPSQSQLNLLENVGGVDPKFFSHVQKIIRNKNFWLIVFSLGMANGVWNSLGILINTMYLNYFPNGENDAGIIALLTIISGGCIGSIFFGIILDKTHHFKRVSFFLLVTSAIMYIFVALSLIEKSRIGTYIVIPIWGFFLAPVLIVGFEYLVEVTYPIPEACSASIFNAAYYFIAIIATLAFEGLFDLIGHLYTFVVIFLIFCSCSMVILMVDSNLKRRDANLQQNEVNSNVINGYSGTTSRNFASTTTVTIAKF